MATLQKQESYSQYSSRKIYFQHQRTMICSIIPSLRKNNKMSSDQPPPRSNSRSKAVVLGSSAQQSAHPHEPISSEITHTQPQKNTMTISASTRLNIDIAATTQDTRFLQIIAGRRRKPKPQASEVKRLSPDLFMPPPPGRSSWETKRPNSEPGDKSRGKVFAREALF